MIRVDGATESAGSVEWMIIVILIVLVGIVLLIYGVILYNGLVNLRNEVRRAWSNIDILLKQRHDEIPGLVDICRGYMKHEREVLERVVLARSLVAETQRLGRTDRAEVVMGQALKSLFAVAESYPDLKADQSFIRLQIRISQLEDAIADRRELYNQYANAMNIRTEQIPDRLIAALCGFSHQELWRISPAEAGIPAVRIDD